MTIFRLRRPQQSDFRRQFRPGGVHSQEILGTGVPLRWVAIFELRYYGWASIFAIWYKDGSQFLPSGIKIGIDFQSLVPSWYSDGSNFCFEARYKSNQDFGAQAAPPYPNVME